MELLAEVVQSNALSEADLERQRAAVLRELEEVESSLQDVCLDMLHATAFQGTPLGQSVLGPSHNARCSHSLLPAARTLHYPQSHSTGEDFHFHALCMDPKPSVCR